MSTRRIAVWLSVAMALCAVAFLALPALASANVGNYYPVRSLPASVPQSLNSPQGIAIALDGTIYVADTNAARVVAMKASGEITRAIDGASVWGQELQGPTAVAVGPDARLYVADATANRISVFERNGTFVRSWGAYGSAHGEFSHPTGIAVDASGSVYVADSLNDRIEVFTSQGVHVRQIGVRGYAAGELMAPYALCLSGGQLYVAEQNTKRVQIFDSASGTSIREIGPDTIDENYPFLMNPSGVSVSGSGSIYVSDGSNCIAVFDKWGSPLGLWQAGGLNLPRASVISGTTLLVADATNNRIAKANIDAAGETWLSPLRPDGWPAPLGLQNPSGVAFAADGSMWVCDTGRKKVKHYSVSGGYLGELVPTAPAAFNTPVGVDVSDNGSVAVADRASDRVFIFAPNGSYETSVGAGELTAPTDVDFSDDGHVYVLDYGHRRIAKFTSTGTVAARYGAGTLGDPQSLVVDAGGRVLVGDGLTHRIQPFQQSGVADPPIGTTGGGPGQLFSPSGLAIDLTGDLIVADKASNRVQRLSPTGALVSFVATAGSGAGETMLPGAVDTLPNGTVVVADLGNDRVQTFSLDAQPPSTTPIGLSEEWRTTPLTVTLSATDTLSGVAHTVVETAGRPAAYLSPVTVSAEGETAVRYWSLDLAGNAEDPAAAVVRIDSQPPSGSVTFAEGRAFVATTAISVVSTLTDTIGITEMRTFNGAEWSSPASYTAATGVVLPGEGPYRVRAEYTDILRNILTREATVTADLTPPVTTVSRTATRSPVNATVGFTITATDTYSGVASTWISIDGRAERAYTGAFSIADEGSHTVTVRSVDNVGNWNAVQTFTFLIDKTAPTGSFATPSQVATRSVHVANGVSGATTMRFDLGSGYGLWLPYSPEWTGAFASEGGKTVRAQFSDEAGNILSAEQAVTCDLSAPVTTPTGLPTHLYVANDVNVSFVATDALTAVAGIRYTLDGSSAATYSAPISITGDGAHSVSYWSVDVMGNTEHVRTHTFFIERRAAAEMTLAGGSSFVATTTVPVSIVSASIADMRYDLGDGNGFSDWELLAPTTTLVFPGEGRYQVTGEFRSLAEVLVSDIASITVDLTPPTCQVSGIPTGPVETPVTLAVSGTDALTAVTGTFYALDGQGPQPFGDPVVVTEVGDHTFSAYTVDAAGNQSLVKYAEFSIDEPLEASVELAGGAAVVNTTTIDVQTVSAGATHMRFDVGDGFGDWVAFQPQTALQAPGAGMVTVTSEFLSRAGTIVSLVATVGVDLSAPRVTAPVYEPTALRSIRGRWEWEGALKWTVAEGLGFESGLLPASAWRFGAASGSTTAKTVSGLKTKYSVTATVTAADAAGNASTAVRPISTSAIPAPKVPSSAKANAQFTVSGAIATQSTSEKVVVRCYRWDGRAWRLEKTGRVKLVKTDAGYRVYAYPALRSGSWKMAIDTVDSKRALLGTPSATVIVR